MIAEIQPQSLPWYAVQTRARWEQPSAKLLAEKGYEVFCPTRPGRRSSEPLFPSYLFCRSTNARFGLIVTTPGVLRLLGRPGHPESVPDAEIASVRRIVAAGLPVEGGVGLTVGSRVRISRGPLSGLVGQIVGSSGGQRLALSINLLQRSVSVLLDPSWLQPSSSPDSVN